MDSSNITELCKIGLKYGTDKTPLLKHAYTPFYYQLFNSRRNEIKKVLELGIGHYRNMQKVHVIYDPGLKRHYHRGASLYMWREFFPNAQIYGADRVPEAIFADERIQTYLIDETIKTDLEKLIHNTGSDIDLVVDDASHRVADQIFAVTHLLPLLTGDFTYIIEDVSHSRLIIPAVHKVGEYDIQVPPIPRKWHGGMLVVIKKKVHGTQ